MEKSTKSFLTVRREMFLLCVSSFLLITLAISAIFLKLMYDNSLRNARESLRECNSQIVTFTEGLFRENAAVLRLLSRNDIVIQAGNGNKEALLRTFDYVLNGNENLTYAYAGYTDGSLYIRGYQPPANYNVTQRPWYQAAITATDVTRLIYKDASSDVWLFSQCLRLQDKSGNVVGVIALDCSNQSISRQLSTQYQYTSQRSFIINSEGTVLIHPSEKFINGSLRNNMDTASWKAVMSGENYAEYLLEGVRSMAYFERIPDTDFTVVTTISSSEVMNPIFKNLTLFLVSTIGLSLVCGLVLSRVFVTRFARPIQELSERIRSLAAGNPTEARTLGSANAEIISIAKNIELIVQDIASREERRKAAEYLSFHDSMTGLYNRRFFEEELSRLNTKRNYPLCLLCCDINGLKLVNDVFGHALGDKLLIAVSNCLQQAMRADDILARMGGDEFSIILPHTAEAEVQLIMRRLIGAFPTESLCGAEISVSLGYAIITDESQSVDDVMRQADKMMYEHKRTESVEMRRHTVINIISAAENEGLVAPPNDRELRVLRFFSAAVCPESEALLFASYRLRRLGLCTLLLSPGYDQMALGKRYTEMGYRILSSLDEYRSIAACVLHYKEHWDGSGWPSGLTGMDIPLLSRIIAITECYITEGRDMLQHKSGEWYDQQLVEMLLANNSL